MLKKSKEKICRLIISEWSFVMRTFWVSRKFHRLNMRNTPGWGRVYTRKTSIQVSKFSKGSSPNNSRFDCVPMKSCLYKMWNRTSELPSLLCQDEREYQNHFVPRCVCTWSNSKYRVVQVMNARYFVVPTPCSVVWWHRSVVVNAIV